jgi:Resolvase, N terminal domain
MTAPQSKGRCAIYTRKSSEEGLEQSFNSLHAQREACEAYILSQRHEGWQVLSATYDDGGFSEARRTLVFQRLLDLLAGQARAHLRNDETDQACSASRERAALVSAIQRYALWLRDIRARSLAVDKLLWVVATNFDARSQCR